MALLHGSYVIPTKAGMTSSRGLRLLAMTTLASTQAKFISIYSCEMKSCYTKFNLEKSKESVSRGAERILNT
ncbi:palindromic element RPE5 domain-containing protein [Rickettsia gravesii]|uniref:palindromic element RPE5 domain-containing protein n=1 Tax=Rickettsia gravesii TaxID=354585 RepID=UPI000A0783FF|nr:palindromic element RPE5 domain-containing protein [Rickettsia gravesii]